MLFSNSSQPQSAWKVWTSYCASASVGKYTRKWPFSSNLLSQLFHNYQVSVERNSTSRLWSFKHSSYFGLVNIFIDLCYIHDELMDLVIHFMNNEWGVLVNYTPHNIKENAHASWYKHTYMFSKRHGWEEWNMDGGHRDSCKCFTVHPQSFKRLGFCCGRRQFTRSHYAHHLE